MFRFSVGVFLHVVLLQACFSYGMADAESDQLDFLTELYTRTSGEMWANNTNWLSEKADVSICDWFGITCAGKWVQKLNLKGNGLGGELPDRWERVPYLESIDMSSNKLLGALPPSVGNLTLSSLLLSGNSLRGPIPDSLGNIGARLLYLDNNQFTGTLPASIAKNPLQGLTLDLNKLTGTVPSEFGDLARQLLVISAAFNDFTGHLPSDLCHTNSCSFQYNNHLECPDPACSKCMVPLCNCGQVCSTSSDCAGGSCPSCIPNSWGVHTCGGQ
jgi:hypothetical protein